MEDAAQVAVSLLIPAYCVNLLGLNASDVSRMLDIYGENVTVDC